MAHWVFHDGQLEKALAASAAVGEVARAAETRAFLYGEHGAALRGPVLGDAAPAFDLVGHLQRQRAFSLRTFGPGARAEGVVAHIRKELSEIEAEPTDLREWVDVVLLALDGAWRAGYEPEAIADAIRHKQTVNETRQWPDWRDAEQGQAIEHIRDR